jgi:long-chain acyl-CoA synthetase
VTVITKTDTLATLLEDAVAAHPDRVAVRHRSPDGWRDLTFAEVGAIVERMASRLIELGIERGDRVVLIGETSPEWTYWDFAITHVGAVVVPVYASSSPDECAWVAGDSGAVAAICQTGEHVDKLVAVRDRLPALRTILSMSDDAPRGHGHAAEARMRRSAISPEDPYTIIYTSGTTGPPKGCALTHGNYRAMLESVEAGDLIIRRDDLTYLYLPLAHALALLMQLRSFEVGAAIAYFGGDTRQIVAELAEVRPTYLPSVPRIFEKIYAGVTTSIDADTLARAVEVGGAVRDLQLAGEPVPPELQTPFDALDGTLFARVRGAFGGRLREAVTGAAPIATEILEFFWACGVPVLEGYGMTETATGASICTLEAHRFGTVGRALPGVDIRIAADGEILVRGANVFSGYHGNADASFGAVVDGWLHTGDLGSLDEDGYLTLTGRKKDIIITAGGKNLTPANLENDLRQTRFVSQAVMYGDRRPYPVMLITLDEEEIVPWATGRGLPPDVAALAREAEVVELIEAELERANARYAPVEQVKRVAILDHDLTQEAGELTPTLKVKRGVIYERYAPVFDAMYVSRPA